VLVVCVLVFSTLPGCAARRGYEVTRVTSQDTKTASVSGETPASAERPPQDSLETFMAKVRKVAAETRPPQRRPAATIEGHDPRLAAALVAVNVHRAPETLRAVAREYRRLQIMDKALEYLNRALSLDRQDAATYDELARVWRDSGMPHVALGDAYRAAHYAPESPVVHNTLGTIFQALGNRKTARVHYERALRLDPAAAYALNNLCYGWLLEGAADRAAQACEGALRIAPGLTAAHNNLGLLHAAAGELDAARAEFAQAGDAASTLYNIGIVHLSRREYKQAAEAFKDASATRPTLYQAAARLRQAGALAARGDVE
jgi:tetratricopeptide (TPR) repeat protein